MPVKRDMVRFKQSKAGGVGVARGRRYGALKTRLNAKSLIPTEIPDQYEAKLLECLLCYERYSVDDILSGLYRTETMICSPCYARMQRKPYAACCFGKPTTVYPNGKRDYGYNPLARECQELCPDRRPCKSIVRGGGLADG